MFCLSVEEAVILEEVKDRYSATNVTFTAHVQVRVGNDKGESKWKTMEVGHPVGAVKNPSGQLHGLSLTSTLPDASEGFFCF